MTEKKDIIGVIKLLITDETFDFDNSLKLNTSSIAGLKTIIGMSMTNKNIINETRRIDLISFFFISVWVFY